MYHDSVPYIYISSGREKKKVDRSPCVSSSRGVYTVPCMRHTLGRQDSSRMEKHAEDLRTSLNNMVSDVAVNMWLGSASDMHRVCVVGLSYTF